MALIVAAAIFWAHITITSAIKSERYGLDIVELVSGMESPLRAVMTYNRAGDFERWSQNQALLSHKLSTPPELSNEQQVLIKSISSSIQGLSVIFGNIINIESILLDSSVSNEQINKTADIKRHLEEKLYAHMDTIEEDSLSLIRLSQENLSNKISIALSGVVVLLLVLAAAMTKFALHMARRIGGSLTQLTHGINQVAIGRLDTQVIIKGNDEISALAINFNRMIKVLEETTKARDLLSFEAEERTKDLIEINSELVSSESRYRNLFDHMSNRVAVFVTPDKGLNFILKDLNQSAELGSGMERKAVIGLFLQDVFDEQEEHGLSDLFHKVWETGEPMPTSRIYIELKSRQSKHLEYWLEGYVYKLPSGEVILVYDDVTDKKIAEDHLRLAATVFENTTEGVIITDKDAVIIEVNRAFTDITQYARDETIGNNVSMLQSGRHETSFYKGMWASIEQVGMWRGEVWNRKKDGTIYPEWLNISVVKDTEGAITNHVAVFTDISVIKRSQERLDYLAHHDPLTDLPNRLMFDVLLKQSLNHAQRTEDGVAVVFIDLDRFKNINDSLGHPAGDDLLTNLAGRFNNAMRKEDTVARIGGDEFIVLLEGVGRIEDAEVAIEKLMSVFGKPFRLQEHEVRVTASMGVSLYPQDGDDPSTLIKNADAAMYLAKDEGRNSCKFYTKELTRNAFEKVLLESALRGALDRDEFYLVYQPQICIESCQLVGLEALLRWKHCDLGLVSPEIFIPLAEANGLIHDIGAWVLKDACQQGRIWLDKGFKFGRIAVNIAGPQVMKLGFTKLVTNILEDTRLPPESLELEVTEGFIMQDTAQAIQQLHELREIGVQLAIDDFGTGYSSLSYLKKLPVHRLKIDRSFVKDIPSDADDMAIAEAVIALGGALDLIVIAEGVETEDQLSFLKARDCNEAQGYLFSQAISADKMEVFLVNEQNKFKIIS